MAIELFVSDRQTRTYAPGSRIRYPQRPYRHVDVGWLAIWNNPLGRIVGNVGHVNRETLKSPRRAFYVNWTPNSPTFE